MQTPPGYNIQRRSKSQSPAGPQPKPAGRLGRAKDHQWGQSAWNGSESSGAPAADGSAPTSAASGGGGAAAAAAARGGDGTEQAAGTARTGEVGIEGLQQPPSARGLRQGPGHGPQGPELEVGVGAAMLGSVRGRGSAPSRQPDGQKWAAAGSREVGRSPCPGKFAEVMFGAVTEFKREAV